MAILTEARRPPSVWSWPDSWPTIFVALVSLASVLIVALLAVVVGFCFR